VRPLLPRMIPLAIEVPASTSSGGALERGRYSARDAERAHLHGQRRLQPGRTCVAVLNPSANYQLQTDGSSSGYREQASVVCAATPLLLKNNLAWFGHATVRGSAKFVASSSE
jgi:hypothetical protein